ncbi:MAG TPA: TIGR00159 family protein [Ruminococcus sp.]|nr:TIGR00159 family protein [Ruminococcus sp.]
MSRKPRKDVRGVVMNIIRNSWDAFYNVMKSITIVDFLDIALLTYVIYVILKFVKETRAGQLMKGIVLLVAVYFISDFLKLKAISWISLKTLNVGLIAVIVLFQPELRRVLEKFGQTTSKISRLTLGESEDIINQWNTAIPIICDSVEQLSKTATGALIVIERGTKLGEHILNGTVMKAIPSTELFGNIFYNKTPLHDGAVIMRDGIIWAAACFLPKPQKEELIDKHLGSRHRAAIGMSENSDALVIVVSEETGQISVAQDGILTRNYTRNSLEKLLRSILIPQDKDTWRGKTVRIPFRRKKPSETAAEQQAPAAKEAGRKPASKKKREEEQE